MKLVKIWFLLTFFSLGVIIGCGDDESRQDEPEEATLVYIQWDEGIAYTHLAANILEEKMGYDVTLISAELDAAYKSIAENDADAFMESWQPMLHKSYMEKYGGQLADLGPVFDSTKTGLVVPSYMPVDSIRQLRELSVRKRLNGTITGIEQGAGIMRTTRELLNRYDLDYQLQSSSGPAMTAVLKRAIMNREWVVVTGWKPHWMFGKWDLKFLKQDPDKQLWSEDKIHIMGMKNIREKKPTLAAFLQNMHLSERELYDLMLYIEENKQDADLTLLTKIWMEDHPSIVNEWIPAKRGDQ